ncbi:MAG: nodulation protein NfeD [Armatimonadetes bacterium]|nr:nodulation protein NfeD [Armatimonadota bacterium]
MTFHRHYREATMHRARRHTRPHTEQARAFREGGAHGPLFRFVGLVPAAILLTTFSGSLLRSDTRTVNVIRLDDEVINPVTARYILRGIDRSEKEGAEALVLVLDTPGGLVTSMKEIVTRMVNSRVPIIVYVAPRGAISGSAGVFITMASHVAAMAPETSIGAAHPVSAGPEQPGGKEEGNEPANGKSNREVLDEKMTNILVSMVKSVAKPRGRNIEWAEEAVRKSIAATAEEALKLKVVEYVANSLTDLLKKADGATVQVMGETRKLNLTSASTQEIPMRWSEQFLATISNPQIAYILMTIAMLGIVYEFMNPGAIFPGIVGGISLLLAMFSLSMLPINYAGVALILLGIGLMIADIKVPSAGLLTVGGVIAFLLGSVMLVDPAYPFLRVPWRVIIPTVVIIASFFAFCVGAGLKAQKARVVTGQEGMVGLMGRTRTAMSPDGQVFVHGELWGAQSLDGDIEKDARVVVVESEGLHLKVKRIQ